MSVYTSSSLPFALGRVENHDPRSQAFAVQVPDGTSIKSKTWRRHSPSLDQGNLGSCVPNAGRQTLMTSPFYTGKLFTEADAVADYHEVTGIDPFPGQYPPDDTGSDGTSLGNLYRSKGLIRAFRHAFSLDDALGQLMHAPGILGIRWRYDMFFPDSTGMLSATGVDVGGHEIELEGVSLARKAFIINNSWSPSWGINGRAFLPFAYVDFELIHGGADIIFFEV